MNNRTRSRGFTLIELVILIAVIAIIAVSVMPKWTNFSLGLDVEAQRVQSDLRYVQAMSMSSGSRYYWMQESSSSYSIHDESGSAVILPSGGSVVNLSEGIIITSLTNLPNSLISFSSLGVPYVTNSIPGTALAATASISLSKDGRTKVVQILPETGYTVVI